MFLVQTLQLLLQRFVFYIGVKLAFMSRLSSFIILWVLINPWYARAQHDHTAHKLVVSDEYDTDLLSPEFHKNRREALRKLMPANSVAFFFSSPVRTRSNDVDYEYHQDPNFYYLTGHNEPNAVLVIFKEMNAFGQTVTNEILFVQPRNKTDEAWTGYRLGADSVKSKLKIDMGLANTQFNSFDFRLKKFDKVLSFPVPADVKDDKNDRGDLYSMLQTFKSDTDSLGSKYNKINLAMYMAQLREIKLPEEIALMKKAIEITCKGQMELMRALKPGMKEFQGEAIMEYMFHAHGAEHEGFPCIMGGGQNSCILHYQTNRKKLNNKDLLVSDVGAEYHGYTADVTRTLPVDGKFSTEEAAIYKIVFDAQTAAITKCRVGNKFWDPHDTATAIIAEGLMKLGIIKKPSEVKEYFFHGTSHYLGLDVHDVGMYGALKENQVITVEPGIYIAEGSPCDPKWWNIGIRIEDDILITQTGPVNLSACVPREMAEIERVMNQNSPFEYLMDIKK
jgi:Xaa-Pro aminopeptidase